MVELQTIALNLGVTLGLSRFSQKLMLSGSEIIRSDHLVPRIKKPVDEVAADETGGTSHEELTHATVVLGEG
jgi:hypothetical protein